MFHASEDSIRVDEISKKRGISMDRVSLAWSLTRVTAPIVGNTNRETRETDRYVICSLCINVVTRMVIKLPLTDGVDVKLAEEEYLLGGAISSTLCWGISKDF